MDKGTDALQETAGSKWGNKDTGKVMDMGGDSVGASLEEAVVLAVVMNPKSMSMPLGVPLLLLAPAPLHPSPSIGPSACLLASR